MTIRRTGDDAVSRTTLAVGLDETYQISLIPPTSIYSYQRTVVNCPLPPIPDPTGRFRANGSHQIVRAELLILAVRPE